MGPNTEVVIKTINGLREEFQNGEIDLIGYKGAIEALTASQLAVIADELTTMNLIRLVDYGIIKIDQLDTYAKGIYENVVRKQYAE